MIQKGPAYYFKHLLIYGLCLIFIAPFLLSILLAFKSKEETSKSILAPPQQICWENFSQAIDKANIFVSAKNSLLVTACAVCLVLLVSSMAGYAIGRRYDRKLYKIYETILLASMMIPFQTLMIPIYRMYKSLRLLNTLYGVIIIVGGLNMAFAIMMYTGFVRTIPIELEEAAVMEGCGKFTIFFKIVFPLLKPITSTVAVLNALWIWNEFNASLLILQKKEVKTIPIQQFVFFGEHSANYNMAFAAAVITMIPMILFFIIAQKYIVEGMTNGAVKG